MTYVIQKKTKCDNCDGGVQLRYKDGAYYDFCDQCGGVSYIYEEVDLLDVLKRVEWTTPAYGAPEGVCSVHAFGDDVRVKE